MAKKRRTRKLPIGDRIAAARKLKGWTQESLARKCKVSVKTVSAWECGKALPSMPSRARLMKWLGVE